MRPDLVPIAIDWSNWVGVMVTTHFGLVLGLFLAPRGPKRSRFGPKCLFWGSWMDLEGPRGPDLVPTSSDWSAWAGIIVYHTLWPGIGPLLVLQGPQKSSFWLKRPLLGVLEGLGGPPGARFGPNCHRLLCLGWTHGSGPLPGGQGPQKRPI